MAIYMKLDKLDTIAGAATVPDVGGKKGLMAVDNVQFGAGRPIGIVVGSSTHAETGQVDLSDISVARTCDGASPFIQTFFFQPGGNGRTIDFVITKADRKGAGMVPSMIITLEEARLTSYSLSASSAQPAESYSIAYTSIAIAHYNEEDNGEIKKGDTIKFDLATAKLVSAAKLP
ncbi:type VI secretion system tube protein Hcp [Donghicola sp. XS_ASV15]|uniref:type VI secretion system tube protein Hcp n=1 Tax=Donghicola sp. XS_ASV15 TaxID=3241295 RepID=UPI003514AE3B